ncbi:MAG TPA: efflux RND transporter periplasmic adaptor subunit [bacterium]|jgi:RND family efflux transporter MFP subunit
MRRILTVAIIVVIAGLLGWRTVGALRARQAQSAPAPRPGGAVVQTARVQRTTLSVVATYVGEVLARASVDVAPRLSGQVVALPVVEGQAIRVGQLVARLDGRDLGFAVEQARAAYANQRVQVESARAFLNTQRARLVQLSSGVPAEQIAQAEAQLRQARLNLEFSRAQLRRMESLFAQGYVSAQRVDEARLDVALQESRVAAAEQQLGMLRREPRPESVRVSQAQVDEAQVALRQAESRLAQAAVTLREAQSALAETVVISPMTGVVAKRFAEVGQQVTPAIALVRVVDISTVFITIPVTERDLARITVGLPVTVRAEAVPGVTFGGRIAGISPLLSTATRTADAKIAIVNPAHRLRPGMFAGVEILVARRPQALVVPVDAVLDRPGGQVVFVIKDAKAAERRVQTGFSSGGVVEIVRGLHFGEVVAVSGHRALRDGMPVLLPGRQRRP